MCQCLAEMFGLNIDHLLYITYSEESTTFFKVKFSQELWNLVWDQALEDFWYRLDFKTYSKWHPGEGHKFTVSNVEFFCEIPSCTARIE